MTSNHNTKVLKLVEKLCFKNSVLFERGKELFINQPTKSGFEINFWGLVRTRKGGQSPYS